MQVLGGIGGQQTAQALKQLLLHLVQQVKHVLIVGVKGAPVHVGPLGELLHGDGAHILLLQQLQHGLLQAGAGAAHPAVGLPWIHIRPS